MTGTPRVLSTPQAMLIVEAVEIFSRREDRSILEFDSEFNGLDIWPEAAAAAVGMIIDLEEVENAAQLDEFLETFGILYRDDPDAPINLEKWRVEIARVMGAVAAFVQGESCVG